MVDDAHRSSQRYCSPRVERFPRDTSLRHTFTRPVPGVASFFLSMADSQSSEGEVDLAIPDMNSLEAEQAVQAALTGVPGIEAVRLVERGAWIRHRDTITPAEICEVVRRAGYRASIFQDSTGRLGRSSQ